MKVRTRGGRRLTFTGAVRTTTRKIDLLSTAVVNVKQNTKGYTVRLLLDFLGGPGCGMFPMLGFVRRRVLPLGKDNTV